MTRSWFSTGMKTTSDMVTAVRDLSCGNEREALRSFARAFVDTPRVAALCTARMLIMDGNPEAAALILRDVLAEEPGLVEARVLLGMAQRNACRMFEAMATFREALRLDPDNARAADALAELVEVDEP